MSGPLMPADMDAAYIVALRAIVRSEGRKRRPRIDEVTAHLPPLGWPDTLRLRLYLPGLHRLHGAER